MILVLERIETFKRYITLAPAGVLRILKEQVGLEIRCRSKIFARTICNYSGDLDLRSKHFGHILTKSRTFVFSVGTC